MSPNGFCELRGELARSDEVAVFWLSKDRLEIWSSVIGEEKGNFEIVAGKRSCSASRCLFRKFKVMIARIETRPFCKKPSTHKPVRGNQSKEHLLPEKFGTTTEVEIH